MHCTTALESDAVLIAQITDTHIRAEGKLCYGKLDTFTYLERCVAHINALSPRPDAVLVTGDITDFACRAAYERAAAAFAQLVMPFYLVPGNHDDPALIRAVFNDHEYLPDAGFVQYAIDTYAIRLIGLDTQVIGESGGLLCAQRLAWLTAQLLAAPNKPTLLFMHHPPFETGIGHMDVQNCANAAALGHLVQQNQQIKYILCGHVHRQIETAWCGTVVAVGPSPAHAVALDIEVGAEPSFVLEPPCIKLLHWNGAQLIGHLSFIGEFAGPYPFYDAAGKLID